jgi:hypothetical protein
MPKVSKRDEGTKTMKHSYTYSNKIPTPLGNTVMIPSVYT